MLNKSELEGATLNLPSTEHWGQLARALYPNGVPPEELTHFIPRCVEVALQVIELLAEGAIVDLADGRRIAISIDSTPVPRGAVRTTHMASSKPARPGEPLAGAGLRDLLDARIDALELPPATIRALTQPHGKYRAIQVRDLLGLSEGNLLAVRGVGTKGIDAIKHALTARGLHLNMSDAEIQARLAVPQVVNA